MRGRSRIMRAKAIVFITTTWLYATAAGQDTMQFAFNKPADLYPVGWEMGMKVINWNDGLLTMGWCQDSNQKRGLVLTHLDTIGNILWNKIYFDPATKYFQGTDIIAFDSNTFYVAGIRYQDTLYDWDIFIARFNTNGDSLYFRHYQDSGMAWADELLLSSPDSLLLLSSWRENSSSIYWRYSIIRVDASGYLDTLYQSPLSLKLSYQLFRYKDRFFVGGRRRTNTTSNYEIRIFVDHFDAAFNLAGTWTMPSSNHQFYNRLFSWNGRLHIAYQVSLNYPPFPYPFYKLRVARLTDWGVIDDYSNIGTWSQMLDWGFPNVLNDSLLVFVNFDQWKHGFYFLNDDLDSLWYSVLPYDINLCTMEAFPSVVTPSGRIAGTGYIHCMNQDHVFYLTDIITGYLEHVTSVMQTVQHSPVITVYPVPFCIQLKVDTGSDETTGLEIFDLSGRLVKTATGNGIILLETSEMPGGAYILHVRSGNTQSRHKVIKVEN